MNHAYPCQPSLTTALKSRIIYLGLSFTGDVAGGPLVGYRWGLAPAFHLQTPVFTCLEVFSFPKRLVDNLRVMQSALFCSVCGWYCSMELVWNAYPCQRPGSPRYFEKPTRLRLVTGRQMSSPFVRERRMVVVAAEVVGQGTAVVEAAARRRVNRN